MTRNVILSLTLLVISSLASLAKDKRPIPSKTDALMVRAQKICPVSGKKLMSMGGPIKATVGGEIIFLCCKVCAGRTIRPGGWMQIRSNLIASQQVCPVRGKPLPRNPASAVVNHRVIFVCCKPCIAKVRAEPSRYVGIVTSLIERNLKAEK